MLTEGVGGLLVRFYEALHNDHDLTMFDTAVDSRVVSRWSGLTAAKLKTPGRPSRPRRSSRSKPPLTDWLQRIRIQKRRFKSAS